MKEYKIEIEVDDKGNIAAETFGMKGKICAEQLDKILQGIQGDRQITNTPDYYKSQPAKQTVRRG